MLQFTTTSFRGHAFKDKFTKRRNVTAWKDLLESVGVVTRSIEQEILPCFFYVIMTTQHGHAKPPYRATYQSRLRREWNDSIGVCEANPPWAKHRLQYFWTSKYWCLAVSKNLFSIETQFLVRCWAALWIDSTDAIVYTSFEQLKSRNSDSVSQFAKCFFRFMSVENFHENGDFINGL